MSMIVNRMECPLPHIANYTPKPNDTKICQWYCCLCGQLYGSIIYKKTTLPDNHPAAAVNPAAADNESVNDYLIRSIKYYSQIVYNLRGSQALAAALLAAPSSVGASPHHHDDDDAVDDNVYAHEISPYDNPEVRRLASFNDILSPLIIEETNLVVTPTPVFIRTTSTTAYNFDKVHSLCTDGTAADDVILNIPTRFTCHRCDHMMCPYCPKVRVKDL